MWDVHPSLLIIVKGLLHFLVVDVGDVVISALQIPLW